MKPLVAAGYLGAMQAETSVLTLGVVHCVANCAPLEAPSHSIGGCLYDNRASKRRRRLRIALPWGKNNSEAPHFQ